MSMGGNFFQTWICMAMIFEPYLVCYSSIFSPDLVCCSWDYGLSVKWSSILNRDVGNMVKFGIENVIWEYSETDLLPYV